MSPDDPPPPPSWAARKGPVIPTPPLQPYAPAPPEPPKKRHIKRNLALWIVLPILLVCIGVTVGGESIRGGPGFSAAGTTTPAATTTAPAATTTVPVSPDNAYLDEVYRLLPWFAGDRGNNVGGTTSLLFLGNNACQEFVAGALSLMLTTPWSRSAT